MLKLRILAVALLSSTLLLIASCADWRSYSYDSTHFSRQPSESTLNASTVSTLHVIAPWPFVVPGGAALTASPAVYDNTVYVGSLDGHFYAVWATGASQATIRWQYPPVPAPGSPDACGITSQPLVISPTVGSGNPSGPGIASSASIVDSVAGHTAVMFGAPDPTSNGGDGRLWALDEATGHCIWKSDILAPVGDKAKIGYSSPVIAHNRAYVGISARIPDDITVGKLFAVMLADGHLDPGFHFSAVGGPGQTGGGGIWSSPAVTPSGNIVITTGNSLLGDGVPAGVPNPDYTNSILKLDWTNGNVLWQVQPVDVQHEHDADYSASAIVGQVSCGSLAISVQKDGWVHAVDIKNGGPFWNPSCSYAGHTGPGSGGLECPRWSFPTVASLPFTDDGHGDSHFKRPGALDGDHLFIAAGGLDLEPPPGHSVTQVYNRLHSLNVCASDADRIRWILPNLASNAGGVSVANGVIYLGTWDPFDTGGGAHHFYAIADTDVIPPTSYVCSYPSLPSGFTCFMAGLRNVPVPNIVRDLTLIGSIQAVPAIVKGQVYVATNAGYLYALGK